MKCEFDYGIILIGEAMKKITDMFMNMRFSRKLMLSFFIVALLPLVGYLMLTITTTIDGAVEVSRNSAIEITANVSGSMDIYINSIDKQVNFVICEINDQDLLSEENWEKSQDTLQSLLNNIAISNKEIAGIMLATSFDDYVGVNIERKNKDVLTRETWYQNALQIDNSIYITNSDLGRNISYIKEYSTDAIFSVAKVIKSPNGEILGVILFDLTEEILATTVNDVKIGENGFVFITDKSSQMIFTPINDVVYRIKNEQILASLNAPMEYSINGNDVTLISSASNYSNWITTGVIYQEDVNILIYDNMQIFIVFLIICMLIIFMFSVYMSRLMTKPIAKLKNLMKKAAKGDLKVAFNSKYHDEIGNLGDSFDEMIKRIDSLLKMVYDEQQSKRIAELKMLQEQIKPHFLYNTLDTISWMAREKDSEDIVQLVDALTNMFRIGLSKGKEYITLEEEIKHVSNYLYIQSVRYGEKLNYQVEILGGEIKDILVPKLILQPLVENAIYHGIKMMRTKGEIKLKIY